jgi:hypothetical protein
VEGRNRLNHSHLAGFAEHCGSYRSANFADLCAELRQRRTGAEIEIIPEGFNFSVEPMGVLNTRWDAEFNLAEIPGR